MAALYDRVRIVPAGDQAVLVEVGEGISPEVNGKVRRLFLAIRDSGIPGVVDLIPAYRSLLVCYDPLRISIADLLARLSGLEQRLDHISLPPPRLVAIPTVYGGEYGPDLPHVADHNGLSPEQVIDVHAGADYLVYMMGFSPGFTYLGGMSERIATPRLKTPRTAIPAGSVGIAQTQTGIYPVTSPGGWQLIGRTPVHLFDATREPPTLVEPGDFIRFIVVSEQEFKEIARQVEEGRYTVEVRQHQ